MSKTTLAIGLLFVGALTGALAGTAMVFGNQSTVVWFFGIIGFLSAVLGSVLLMSKFMDATVHDFGETVGSGLDDDLTDLRNGVLGYPVMLAGFTFMCTLIYWLLLLRYHKFEANWNGIPVWLVAALASGVLFFLVSLTAWFKDRDFDTPNWVSLIAIGAFALALVLGIAKTEDTRLLNPTYSAEPASYNYQSYYFYSSRTTVDPEYTGSYDFDMPECSGKSCEGYGYLILLIIFIVLVLILVVGSAVIAHFWVVAGALFITILLLLTIQELMFSPYSHRRRRYSTSW